MSLHIRKPTREDGQSIFKLIRNVGGLDLNSEYSYFMIADLFRNQCAVVVDDKGEIHGFASGILRPEDPETLFIWQICTDNVIRGKGMAKQMIEFIIANQRTEVKYIEATIDDQNISSQSLFKSIAKHFEADVVKSIYIRQEEFSDAHTSEYIYRIGTLKYSK